MVFKILYQNFPSPNFALPKHARTNSLPPPPRSSVNWPFWGAGAGAGPRRCPNTSVGLGQRHLAGRGTGVAVTSGARRQGAIRVQSWGVTHLSGSDRSASAGFRFSWPYLRVMSATTRSCGTIVALDCSDSCFRELSRVRSGKRAKAWTKNK